MSGISTQPLQAGAVRLAVHLRSKDGLVHGVICTPALLWSVGVRRHRPSVPVVNEVGGTFAEARCVLLSMANLRRDEPFHTRTSAAIMLCTLSAGCYGAVARARLRLSLYAQPAYPSALTAKKV